MLTAEWLKRSRIHPSTMCFRKVSLLHTAKATGGKEGLYFEVLQHL